MRIKVFTPLGMHSDRLDERGWMELDEGSTLADALKKLGMPKLLAKTFMVRLNSEELPMNTPLHDGDMISFFSLICGG